MNSFKQLTTIILLAFLSVMAQAQEVRSVTDIAGRQVTLPATVSRLILGEGRYLSALAIVDPEAAQHKVVGMLGEMKRYDPGTWAQFVAVYPEVNDIPVIGGKGANSFSVEKAISLRPDVAIFGLQHGHGPTAKNTEVVDTLEKAGIAVVFIDFRQHPFLNTPRSIAVLGEVLGQQLRASQFVESYNTELAKVVNGLLGFSGPKPKVFVHSRVGLLSECCETIAHKMFADFVDVAGGDNLGRRWVKGDHGVVNVEYLLTEPPDIYVATAIGHFDQRNTMTNTVLAGAYIQPVEFERSLRKLSEIRGLAQVSTIKQGQVYGMWHHFYISPFNVVALQAMAQWFHPERFKALDPDALLDELHRRYMPFKRDGTYWGHLSGTVRSRHD